MRRIVFLLLGLAGLSSLLVAQSGAQSTTKPAPACAGVAASDSDKDGVSHSLGIQAAPGGAAPDNLEITRVWFDRTSGKTTANVEVKKLSKANLGQGTSISWYVTWTKDDADHFVAANSDGNEVAFDYGDYDATQGLYSSLGETSGKLFDGDKGVVQIVIPSDIGGSVGSKLTDPYASTFENTDTGVVNSLSQDDNAPDEGGGKSWTVTDCAAGPTGPTGPTGPVGPGNGQVVQTGALNAKAKTALGSAKTAAKKKKVSVSLTGNATSIQATLYKGSFASPKTYGKGKLASLNGKAKLKLKLRKKVKKGKYALTLIGTNPDGARAEKSFKVKFKK